jgi:hypothetical protein
LRTIATTSTTRCAVTTFRRSDSHIWRKIKTGWHRLSPSFQLSHNALFGIFHLVINGVGSANRDFSQNYQRLGMARHGECNRRSLEYSLCWRDRNTNWRLGGAPRGIRLGTNQFCSALPGGRAMAFH